MLYTELLNCSTPSSWIHEAMKNLDILLIDHANCEKKAANTALHLMFRYIEHQEIQIKLSKLAREELRHYEQVLLLMNKRKISYQYIDAANYAQKLISAARNHEPGKLVDRLIISAFIEARSCERFYILAPFLDPELKFFYQRLAQSESRHFTVYLDMAQKINNNEEDMNQRIKKFAALENDIINTCDAEFRLHSGPPLPNPIGTTKPTR